MCENKLYVYNDRYIKLHYLFIYHDITFLIAMLYYCIISIFVYHYQYHKLVNIMRMRPIGNNK